MDSLFFKWFLLFLGIGIGLMCKKVRKFFAENPSGSEYFPDHIRERKIRKREIRILICLEITSALMITIGIILLVS